MQSISKKKSTTTKKIDMSNSIDEQYRKEGRHKIVVPRSTPNVKTEPVNKPKTPDLKSTEERMKKHVERVMEQLRASSAFLGLSQLDEKKLTPAEKKKREEIAQAIERKNPGMDMGRKMAIATAQAKKVAEEVDTGQEAARKKQPSSKEEQEKVFAKHKERMKKLASEEVEQIDEADEREVSDKLKRARDYEKVVNSRHNSRAHTKEIQVGVAKDMLDNAHKAASQTPVAKFLKTRKGDGKVRTEEVEQIDELSKGTLGKYISKAVVDVHNDAKWAGETDDRDAKNKAYKRLLGVKSASARLGGHPISKAQGISGFRREEVELDEKVLATHNDVTVHNVGDGEIHVRKNGKTIAHGDYDHEGGGFWISHHSHKGQKGFNRPDEIAKHYHSVHESEEKERDYIVVHAKKGTHKTTAKTSYEAAKKAASHWRLKSTAGIDAHPAKSDRFMYEESELDESMENLSLKQWSKIHRDHHEFGGGSKASQRKMSQIEKHVHKKYGKEAMHKMIKDTEDYASGGGSGPVRESAVSSADFKLDKTGRKYPAHRIKTADDEAPFEGGRTIKSKKSADERVGKIAKGMMKQYTKEAVQDATTPSNAQETIMKSGGVKALAQSIKAKKRASDKFDPNPEFVSQVQPNASNY